MNLSIVGDLHLSQIWKDLKKELPDFKNTNTLFKRLVKKLNLTKETLIINGDIVDSFLSDYFGRNKKSNWEIFKKIIKNYQGKIFLNPGNHEYRLLPYNFLAFRLGGMKPVQTDTKSFDFKKAVKKLKLARFRWLKEFQSLVVSLGKFDPVKADHLKNCHSKNIGQNTLVFLNTGHDAFAKLPKLVTVAIYSLIGTRAYSIGLNKKQIIYLRKILKKSKRENVILFLHCPPFLSFGKVKPVKLRRKFYFARLFLKKYAHEFFFKNNWQLIETLTGSNKNIIVVTSHSHFEAQYLLNKKTSILSHANLDQINSMRDRSRFVKFISTPNFGGSIIKNNKTGYLKITEKEMSYQYL